MRGNMALVQQEPVLFDCSIMENITYGLVDMPYEKVVQSAKLANIHDFVLSLPEVSEYHYVRVCKDFFSTGLLYTCGRARHAAIRRTKATCGDC